MHRPVARHSHAECRKSVTSLKFDVIFAYFQLQMAYCLLQSAKSLSLGLGLVELGLQLVVDICPSGVLAVSG